MDRTGRKRARGRGHRPLNTLGCSHTSSLPTKDRPKDVTTTTNDTNTAGVDFGKREETEKSYSILPPVAPISTSSPFLFTNHTSPTLSQLGDSSSLFSTSPSGSHRQIREGTSPYQFNCSTPDTKHTFEFHSSPPEPDPELVVTPLSQLHTSISDFVKSLSSEMVVEREPPRASLSSSKQVQQTRQPVVAPEFGKATSLQSPLRSSVFNIPKAHKARPEHHRPPPVYQSHEQQGNSSRNAFVDPFRPQQLALSKPSNATQSDDDDVVEIPKPADTPAWGNYSGRPGTYPYLVGSAADLAFLTQPKGGGKVGRLIDLTSTALYEDKFGAEDPYEYVDVAKATENIKALLEGAFEDENDKPKTRGKKKKVEADTAELLNKLQGLNFTPTDEKSGESPQVGEEDNEDDEDDGTIDGLKVKLLPHQVIGVDWMREREAGTKKKNGILPKGGILADDMGLGKTIQSIALLLTNPRPPLSSNVTNDKHKLSNNVGKGTIVVAPLALIKQWEAEISNRVKDSHALRVCVHHGPQRTKRFEDLRKYDIVITTYQILVSEYGNSAHTGDGPKVGCFGIHWYRAILDEAHMIKNRNAKAAQACYALRAEYRWCLTGTPMQNNLDELQSLIKFLRIKPYNELPVWRDQITNPMKNGRGDVAMKRLQVYLTAFMKRRTKDVLKVDGALNPGGKADVEGNSGNGFKITERRIEKIVVDFSVKERVFYDKLEKRTDQSLAQMMGGKSISYASALVLLLRLRQACNHPELTGEAMAKDKDALTTGQVLGSQTPWRSKVIDKDLDDMADLLGGLSVQTKQCDMCQIKLTKEESSAGSIRCAECEANLAELKVDKREKKKHKSSNGPVRSEVKSEIPNHRSQKNRKIIMESDDEEEEEVGDWVVPQHQRGSLKLGKAGGSDDENAEGGGEWLASEDSDTGDEGSIQILGSHRKKVMPLSLTDDDSDTTDESLSESEHDEDDLSSSDESSFSSFATSTKIQHLLKILHRESSTHKFIVFSQFTSMLNLIEPFLKRDGLVFSRYDGSMRNDHREASLERLRNEKKTRILLCSLKCGSLGLNLTAASRVVILEPFWNPFVEEQAIDRVHRLNQIVDVIVYKITIANSVEERILDLQEKKRFLAEAAIEGKAAAKLSLQDIMNLFKREAEHDTRLNGNYDGAGLGTRSRVLPESGPSVVETGTGTGGRKMASLAEKRGGGERRDEGIYGRRW